MSSTTNLFLLAVLAAPGIANEPRQAGNAHRPVPVGATSGAGSDAKLPAPPVVTTPELLKRAPAPAGLAPAQIAKPFERGGTRVAAPPIERLRFATDADGSTWVRGRTYKARFGPGGATYVPFLGSDAPRNFPLELSLGAATAGGHALELAPATSAVREGDTVVIGRGPVDEVYELSLDVVEQTFVVRERPAAGDLVLLVRLDSEMSRCETADGLEFANEHGAVRYGRAFVREADGDRVPVPSRAVADGVEIEIGRDYLATAEFPLVVDPIVTTFPVDGSSLDHIQSDSAYDLTTDRFLITYEEVFSATDGDVCAQIRRGDGAFLALDYVDLSFENWRSPQSANLNGADQFLCVAQCNNVAGSTGWVVRARTIAAANVAIGNPFNVSSTDAIGDKVLADVGGDPYDAGGPSYYCVVWQRNYSATDTDVHARMVTPQSTLVGSTTILIDDTGSTLDGWPSVSKSNGVSATPHWTVAWHRAAAANNYDIRAARLAWTGVIVDPSAPIDISAGTDYYPRVSSPLDDGTTLVVYAHDYFSDHDIEYTLLSGTTVLQNGSLTALDSPGFVYQNQIEYSVDSDGRRFVVAFAENFGTSTFDYDIVASTFGTYASTLYVTEARWPIDYSGEQALRTDVVAMRSGGASSRRFLATWDTTSLSNQHDVLGALYDRPLGGSYSPNCAGDGSGAACPCGNSGAPGRGCANSQVPSGALLTASGISQTGAGDTLVMVVAGVPATATCTLFQGSALNAASAFGDGLRCAGGSVVRIRTKAAAGGTATWPSGAESDISVSGLVSPNGGLLQYQVMYRNPASFCTSATFNISNGMRVLWLP